LVAVSPSPQRIPAYGAPGTAQPERLPWARVVVRMVLIILPGLLVGSFVGATLVGTLGVGVLRDHPGITFLMPVLAGLIAGVGLGVLLKPERDRLVAYVLVSAAVNLAAFLLLFALAQLRAPAAAPPAPLSAYLGGPLIAAVTQSLLAVGLWILRIRQRG
jgi:hypothetical protein